MLVILAGTFNVMSRAFATEKTVRDVTTLGANMRAAMDLVTRDMIQVGQGLPSPRIAGIPNGAGATQIRRPGPAPSGACPGVTALRFNPTTAVTAIPAVTPGPNLGPPVNTVCTDVVTTLAMDSAFEKIPVAAIPNSTSLIVYRRGAPDRGQIALVDVVEGYDLFSSQASSNRLGRVAALLHRGGRDAGERLAVFPIENRGIANDVDLRMAGQVA
jgi:hypothetical protein